MAVISNRVVLRNNEGTAVIHLSANASLTIEGNTGVSDVATVGEVVQSAKVSQIWFGTGPANSFWSITSGNTVTTVGGGSGHINFAGHGASIPLEPGETLDVTLTNATDGQGFIMIELKKKSVAE